MGSLINISIDLTKIDKSKIKEIIPIVESYYWSDAPEIRKQLFGM